jgi:hypothetical protein
MLNVLGFLGVTSGIAAAALWLVVLNRWLSPEEVDRDLWVATLSTTVASVVFGLLAYAVHATALGEYEDRRDRQRAEEARAARDALLGMGETELTRLLTANRELLDEYQKPVRRQARTSYLAAQIATFVGLGILVAGTTIILALGESSARLGVGALAAVGAALSGFIARTFLRVYERAQDQLNFYFREPLVTSYLLTAERIAGKLEGELRQQALADMVSEIVRAVRGNLSPSAAGDEEPPPRPRRIRK